MKNNIRPWLLGLASILLIAAIYLIIIYVPNEATMGVVQRIFYIMVPMGWLAMLSYLIIFIASILYLRRKDNKWDTLAYSAAELGIIATSLTLFTGSMWARPIWGVWWTWEPRLTATLVLWVIYLAYFMVRSFATEESRGATFAAIVGIVGFVDIPIIGLSTSLWRGMHPPLLIFKNGLAPSMSLTLMVSIVAFTVLYAVILSQRVSLRSDELELKKLKEQHG